MQVLVDAKHDGHDRPGPSINLHLQFSCKCNLHLHLQSTPEGEWLSQPDVGLTSYGTTCKGLNFYQLKQRVCSNFPASHSLLNPEAHEQYMRAVLW